MASQEIRLKELVHWPESMWPIDLDILDGLPLELLPDIDALQRLTYPWELLILLRGHIEAKITKSRIAEEVQIDKMVHIEGPVWIENGVVIYPFSVIIGPTYVGKNVTVGNFTQIRNSFIGNGCLVGERTSVVRSFVDGECVFHRNYLGDSLLAKGVDMGGGTTTANRRLDHRNVMTTFDGSRIDTGMERLGVISGEGTKFGTTCQIMPGVKIGRHCIVGPRSILYTDLADNMRCQVKQELQVEEIPNI